MRQIRGGGERKSDVYFIGVTDEEKLFFGAVEKVFLEI